MKKRARLLCVVFVIAFVFNLIWEELHSVLYLQYRGTPITHVILLHAALFDAAVTTLLALATLLIPLWRRHLSIPLLIALVFAVLLERFALATGRWAYSDMMPIIPLIGTGLTPTVQLAVLAFVSFTVSGLQKNQH